MAVSSPCNKVCEIEPASGYCRGCRRTIEEIVAWPTADDAWKRAVIERLKDRTVRRG
ncbi:DUF1289 domain-containing protein [Rhizorhabdus wittichii DC-6]|jgi:predicted Fe-S protein YdhL (DUF1289 family)|uniref:DUF1289 domain-containing protein n=1 Tax=Rhizorhabdus wittichii TaxID=160791 RepID=UPI00031B7F88|nr:DUF1289 domain-containing protein [Rhizorhabdus wittichii]ARR56296.1 DUF1289 domain-containing protein [Rhizorhabdus wittichii DC-6]